MSLVTAAELQPRRRIPKWLPQVLAYGVSAACLIWALRTYKLDQLSSDLRTIDWQWVLLAAVTDLAAYVCQGWRWNALLAPVARLSFWRTVQAVYIGLFASEVLPLRTGEVIRCYLMAHWNGLRLSLSVTSAVIERVIDGFWLIAAFLALIAVKGQISSEVTLFAELLGGLLIVAAGLMIWMLKAGRHSHLLAAEGRFSDVIRHVVEGVQLMGNWRTLFITGMISFLYLSLQIVTMYLLMKAYRFDYSIWVAAGAFTIVRLGTLIPNAPGNVGVLNIACIVALKGVFETSDDFATGFSFLYLVMQTGPLLVGGAIATALTGLNITELRARAHASQPKPQGVD
jgi:uncharacterized protein (TIRG00374 family)